jgi:hypothetical protein
VDAELRAFHALETEGVAPYGASGSAPRGALDAHVDVSRPGSEHVDAVHRRRGEVRHHRAGAEPTAHLENADAMAVDWPKRVP